MLSSKPFASSGMSWAHFFTRDEETNEFKEEDERMGEQEEKIETDIWTTNDLHMKPVVQLLTRTL